MNQQMNDWKKNQEEKQKKENAEIVAVGLSALMGVNVVRKTDYDKINSEKQDLLDKVKDIDKIKFKLLTTQCKLFAFIQYHSKWKTTTRNFEKRLKKLNDEKVYVSFSDYPDEIADNLKEAYNCYINGLSMSCYIMILRTIEISVRMIYDQHNEIQIDSNGKPKFIPVTQKLNWVKSNRMIGGADFMVAKAFIEARNESVHEVYVPSEKQILAAFETVIKLINKLKSDKD
jgi:hypothetical protein